MRLPRRLGVVLLAAAPVLLAGCNVIAELVRDADAPHYAPLEVWNRTTVDVFLIDSQGRRADVPACGHVDLPEFGIDVVTLGTDEGHWFSFGDGGYGGDGGRRRFLVLVRADGESRAETVPPVALPACEGRPNVIPGGEPPGAPTQRPASPAAPS